MSINFRDGLLYVV